MIQRFFVFVFRQFDCHVFGMHLFDLSYWSSLNFLDVHVNDSVKFEEFGALFLQILFQLFSLLFSPQRTPILHVLIHLMMSHSFWKLCSLFLFVLSQTKIIFTYLSSKFSHSIFIQFKSSPSNIFVFHFSYSTSQIQILFGFLLSFSHFSDILHLVRYYCNPLLQFFRFDFLQFLKHRYNS